jgi:hypothetical protein
MKTKRHNKKIDMTGYEFTKELDLISHKRRSSKVLKPFIAGTKKRSYLAYDLSQHGLKRTVYVHQLVMQELKGIVPELNQDIDHIDGDSANNNPDNLQCISHRENVAKAFSNKTGYVGVSKSSWGISIQVTIGSEVLIEGDFDNTLDAHVCRLGIIETIINN